MRVTMHFRRMPGPMQMESLTLRINTSDMVEALTRALTHAGQVTTVPVVHADIRTEAADEDEPTGA